MKSYTQHYFTTAQIKSRAKTLRRPLTPAENRFWHYVRSRKMFGLKFRRQHPLGKFIADFYCHELKLVVEIDGNIHELNHIKNYDEERELKIKELGLSVLRFTNSDVYYNPAFIELTIMEFIEIRKNT